MLWIVTRWLACATTRQEVAERVRLSSEIFGTSATVTIDAPPGQVTAAAPSAHAEVLNGKVSTGPADGPPRRPTDGQPPEGPPPQRTSGRSSDDGEHKKDRAASREIEEAERDAAFERLLINGYALGLTQARRAFNVRSVFDLRRPGPGARCCTCDFSSRHR